MKNIIESMRSTGLLALLCIAGVSSSPGATTSSKDGQTQTTTDTTRPNGLPMLDTGVKELGLSGKLNWEEDTVYSFDISYGQFLTPNWLLGVEAGISGVDGV